MIEIWPIEDTEIDEAVVLWEACGLVRPRNDAAVDAAQAQNATIIGAFADQHLIGAAMRPTFPMCGRGRCALLQHGKMYGKAQQFEKRQAR